MNQVKYIQTLFGQRETFQCLDARDLNTIRAIPNPLFKPLGICTHAELQKLKRKGFSSEIGIELMKRVEKLSQHFEPNTPILLFDEAPQLMAQAIWQHFRVQHQVFIYKGGIKKLLFEAETVFSRHYDFLVLGGPTGVGKTDLLEELSGKNQQVLNLESLANHQGSTFGNLRQEKQAPQETFLLKLAAKLDSFDPKLPVFTESEKLSLGKNIIPLGLSEQLEKGKMILLTLSNKKRVERLVSQYAGINDGVLAEGIETLKFRIGKEKSVEILSHLKRKNYASVAEGLLAYFDHSDSYQHAYKNEFITTLDNSDVQESAEKLLSKIHSIY